MCCRFTRKTHPLVLFLDDLQWIDAASLKLIEHLLTYADTRYLLLIGAYRDNEVDATHPLSAEGQNLDVGAGQDHGQGLCGQRHRSDGRQAA
jgi:predicted ATPase